jgi:hypothetical protein
MNKPAEVIAALARLVQLASEQFDGEGNAPDWAIIVSSLSDELVPDV